MILEKGREEEKKGIEYNERERKGNNGSVIRARK